MTQKWLGQAVGFPEKTADVRMAQYESGARTPKEDLVNNIAMALDVSPQALNVPDLDTYFGFIHTLFAIEDLHGVKIEKNENEVHMIFDGSKPAMDDIVFKMLSHWAKEAEKLKNGEITREQYDDWRYNYPKYDNSGMWVKMKSLDFDNSILKKITRKLKKCKTKRAIRYTKNLIALIL